MVARDVVRHDATRLSTMPEWKLCIDVPPTERSPEPIGCLPGLLIQHGAPEGNAPDTKNSQGKPLALLVHGSMSQKNALFFKPLAQQLPIDSYRWDMRCVSC